jgi:hypothetical protein
MRLQEYYKFWSAVDNDFESRVDEVIDMSTKVFKKSDSEWYFWVSKDLYIVRIHRKSNDVYHLSFSYNDPTGSELSSITNKHTPFNVMDGVAVVIKNVIDSLNPKIIEYHVFAEKRKIDMFKRVTKYIIDKFENFSKYRLSTRNIELPYELPDDVVGRLKGTEFTLTRED